MVSPSAAGAEPPSGDSGPKRTQTGSVPRTSVPSNRDSSGLELDLPHIPKKVTVGTNPLPHAILCLGLLAFLAHVGNQMKGVYNPEMTDEQRKNRRILLSPVKRFSQKHKKNDRARSALYEPLIRFIMENNSGEDDGDDEGCDLYLRSSSLPQAGWGVYSGRAYRKGDCIRTEYYDPRFFAGQDATAANNPTCTHPHPPWSFLLKPHSMLSNVQWNNTASSSTTSHKSLLSLLATRDIEKGEELFLSWDHVFSASSDDSHRHALARSLPSPDDFERADDLIRAAQDLYFGPIDTSEKRDDTPKPRTSNARWNRVTNKLKPKPSGLYRKESAAEINRGLQLWKTTVSKYDPTVARLLPTTVQTLAMYRQRSNGDWSYPSLLGSLTNQTVGSVGQNAQCISTVQWQPDESLLSSQRQSETPAGEDATSCASSSDSSPAIHRQVVAKASGLAKGDVVVVVPLLVTEQLPSPTPSSEHNQPSDSIALGDGPCLPLTKSMPPAPQLFGCPLNGIEERTNDRSLANVEYRWSNSTLQSISPELHTWLPMWPGSLPASKSLEPTEAEEVQQEQEQQRELFLEKYALSMSWDLVATRDLEPNEVLVVYQPESTPSAVGTREMEFEAVE